MQAGLADTERLFRLSLIAAAAGASFAAIGAAKLRSGDSFSESQMR